MKHILVFGASASAHSINKSLAIFTAAQIKDATIRLLDLNDYPLPLFNVDLEQESGIPQPALDFKKHIRAADGIIISLAEHNGSYTAVFKNLLDWISRIEKSTWLDKPMFLLATSPGKRGGQSVLDAACARFPHMGGKVVTSFSLPEFENNFSPDKGITNPELNNTFMRCLSDFQQALSSI